MTVDNQNVLHYVVNMSAKVFIVFSHETYEGSDVVAVYLTREKAEQHADKLNAEYIAKRQLEWEKMSNSQKKFWGNDIKKYTLNYWTVEEFDAQ